MKNKNYIGLGIALGAGIGSAIGVAMDILFNIMRSYDPKGAITPLCKIGDSPTAAYRTFSDDNL